MTDQVLKAAQDLPNNIDSKQAILKTLQEKLKDPKKIFEKALLHQKL